MFLDSVLAFSLIALAVVLTPGADTVLVLRTSLRAGARAGIITALGVVCGPVVWGAVAGLGVALVVSRSPVLYTTVAAAGGLYLAYLGVQSLRAARACWRSDSEPVDVGATTTGIASWRSTAQHFLTGLTTNLLNPKIGVFYVSIMPGLFIDQPITAWLGALLGLIHGALGLLFLSGVATLTTLARRFLLQPRTSVVTELICGLCLLALATYVLIEAISHLQPN